MSKKSHPGDGTHNCGTKGGSMYGGHFAVPQDQSTAKARLARSLTGLARVVRGRRG
jgi:hypothetical protein